MPVRENPYSYEGTQLAPGLQDPQQRPTALHEAYRKHATELTSIEDRQNRLVLILLGLFGAGVPVVTKIHLSWPAKLYLDFLVLAVAAFGTHQCTEFRRLRADVRKLLVRCELAMEFYQPGAFLKDEMLYTKEELLYATKGQWLAYATIVIWIAGAGLICLIAIGKTR
jgi:hypothetical protein